jgi:hypothetical protein
MFSSESQKGRSLGSGFDAFRIRRAYQLSGCIGRALLYFFLCHRCRPRRKLEHRCPLTLTELRQENNVPVRKFERIVVRHSALCVPKT